MSRSQEISTAVLEKAALMQKNGMKWREVAVKLGLDEEKLNRAIKYQRKKEKENGKT